MADEKRSIIIDIEVDNAAATEELEKVNKELRKNKQDIKDLSKNYEENVTEITRLELKNKDLAKSKQQLTKESKVQSNTLDALRLKTASLTKERNSLDVSTDEGKRRLAELNAELKENTDQLKETEEAGGDYRRNVGDYAKANQGATGIIKGLWTTLAANPLLLIAGLLAGLVKVFSETQAGAEFFRKATATLNTALGFLKDIVEELGVFLIDTFSDPGQAIEDLGNAIKENITNRLIGIVEFIPKMGEALKLVWERDFEGAAKVATDAIAKVSLGVENFTDKAEAAVEKAKELANDMKEGSEAAFALEQALIANEKAQADLLVQQAAAIESQKALNLIIEDQTLALDDRIRAAEEFQQVEADQLAESIRLAEERINILKAQNDITNSTEEDIQRVRDAEIELFNLKAASAERELTNQTKKNTLIKQQEIELTAAIKAEQERRSEAFDKTLKADESAHKKSMEAQLKLAKKVIGKTVKENRVAAEEQAIIDDRLTRLKEENLQKGFAAFESIVKEGTLLGKALALAQIAQDTARAISALTAASEKNPANFFTFGAAGIAQFTAGMIRIGINIAKAKKLLSGGGGSIDGGGGGGSNSGGGSRPPASRGVPIQVTEAVKAEAVNTVRTENQLLTRERPVQVSVVDINTAQDKRRVKLTETQLA